MVPNGVYVTNADIAYIPNIAPDEGLSAPFNAWMTFFGQFFDHGLDLIAKGGNVGKVYIPLQADDPLMAGTDGVLGTADDLPPYLQFMVLTRATVAGGGHEAVNSTTAFVDRTRPTPRTPLTRCSCASTKWKAANRTPPATCSMAPMAACPPGRTSRRKPSCWASG